MSGKSERNSLMGFGFVDTSFIFISEIFIFLTGFFVYTVFLIEFDYGYTRSSSVLTALLLMGL